MYRKGSWSLAGLTSYLEDKGLRSRPTPKRTSKSLTVSRVHRLLTNPYYMGVVEFRGVRVDGRHEALITPDEFAEVQRVLKSHRVAGDRPQVHLNYLSGSIYCSECRGRLVFGRHRSRSGKYYDYYSCTKRATRNRGGTCTTKHYRAEGVVAAVERLWGTLTIPKQIQAEIRAEFEDHVGNRLTRSVKKPIGIVAELAAIKTNQEKLVEPLLQGPRIRGRLA